MRLRKLRRPRGEEEDYWYYNFAPSMMGSIMDLMPGEEPRRRFFGKEPVTEQKPTFGFGRVLDEPEEQS